ncbi:amino acid permease [Bacillus sp. DTU_2020_1000418_1_SI_GHA_SEK_038]|uniref:amino acid permease n=1 Tax=Bacillus sp. DTU_2020_1000418_1_SI_GHA_SEK_038 TaxID=3077585 RepID=UPI0028EBFBF3|nr:amino acid permease [Bacillus sp. DTU_2020_1000418_1_SI_GHA_SEK_038]WNS73823.1 amino acid permease [Bacillus sp. DTU_2020_1000418_1_SI_GHA_SEK_038]
MEIPARAGDKGDKSEEGKKLAWWQLSLIGVGCIIGTGYFVGSGIGVRMTGPAILIAFILAAIGTYTVFDALGKMSAKDPQKGAFRSYAKKAYGRWAGFSSGWVYWFSEMLITGSQLTALSLLTRFWFPDVPLWVFSSIYAVLGVIVIVIGTKGFEKAQNVFAVIKIAAIFMFIILAATVLFGLFGGDIKDFKIPANREEILPRGFYGLWSALIFGFYAFGGIEIMGILATRLKNKEDVRKSGSVMLIILTTIYLISLALATGLAAIDKFSKNESPFVIALDKYDITFFPHVFTGGIIIAGFSTMAASLFAVTSMIVTLAEDGDAPKIFSKKGKLKVPPLALALTIGGLVTSVVMALVMPDSVYEYITTAAGLMLLYNWFFILISFPRLIKATKFDHVKRFIGMGLILLAISGTLFEKSSRPGFFVSILFVGLVISVLLIMNLIKKRKGSKGGYNPQEA